MKFKQFTPAQWGKAEMLCGPVALSIAETGSLRAKSGYCSRIMEHQTEGYTVAGTLPESVEAILAPKGYRKVYSRPLFSPENFYQEADAVDRVLAGISEQGYSQGVVSVRVDGRYHLFGFHGGVVMDGINWTVEKSGVFYAWAK